MESDNEPALVAVVRDAVKTTKVGVDSASDEHSADYDSQSNGAADTAPPSRNESSLSLKPHEGSLVPFGSPWQSSCHWF